MAELENVVGFSSGKTRFSFFNRSLTLNSNSNSKSTQAESFQKHHLEQPTLNRSDSMSKFSNSMESVKSVGNSFTGKVKKLCNFFESRKASSRGSGEASLPSSPSKLKPTKSMDSDSGLSSSFSNGSGIRLPGTEDRIVVYFTSLRGIRRTYEDCYSVRMIFRGFGVWVDERDISMDSAYKKELQSVLGQKNVSLPQVFIRGKHVGGADVINNLFEVGELAKILEGIPKRKPGFVCETCGDVRFVPCMDCSGSRKIFDEDEGILKRCSECNENGLIRCPDCGS
ncbi:glutaredoxin family protein [Senna tora]|uniref:Glutaredoxin family protein n=1 Tax=Senna tora TaxID=362788 RepID=A0A834X0M3_9FABA|nr:glutaredoxin family protein [Senna tora]